jgi:hypothetical protein
MSLVSGVLTAMNGSGAREGRQPPRLKARSGSNGRARTGRSRGKRSRFYPTGPKRSSAYPHVGGCGAVLEHSRSLAAVGGVRCAHCDTGGRQAGPERGISRPKRAEGDTRRRTLSVRPLPPRAPPFQGR